MEINIVFLSSFVYILAFKDTIKPPNWRTHVCELDTENPKNNGYENEDLIVWMRNAALPNFRKLYRRIDHANEFENGLPAGNYSLDITYSRLLP